MKRGWLLVMVFAAVTFGSGNASHHLTVRSRVELFKGSGQWSEARVEYAFDPAASMVIICDMWDRHWCGGANARVAALVKKLEPVIEAARSKGATIVHAPSDTMPFYANAPQRQRMMALLYFAPPREVTIEAPALPIDDFDGGCDTEGDKEHRAWTSEHPGLKIAAADYVSDNGQEIYNLLQSRGIKTVFFTGVHTNMCILNRTFAIKQLTKWGVRCILLRDLTDAMYAPRNAPYVSHERGTELVVEYIERYWGPTALSSDLTAALR